MAILRPDRPVVVDGVFDAASGGPERARRRKVALVSEDRVFVLDPSVSAAADDVEQSAVEGPADAAEEGTLDR
jgi:hypothetical protein